MTSVLNILTTATGDLVLRALDAASLRHAAHAANIANASTEGYRPLRVAFDEQLAGARMALLDRNDVIARRSLETLRPTAEIESASRRIRLDEEIAAMMQNALRYQALLRAMTKNGAFLQAAIHEGRR